ncbi:MAG: OsmC family protein [Kiritimatiellae bacterium]|nr:OsmC family protein [Kiritimatiellia bacterium]
MPELTFAVQGASESPTRTRVRARQFELLVDEPAELGGSDRGPNPVEHVLAGLAGCLNVVAHVVAKEMGIHIRSLGISVSGVLDPARFLGEPTEARAGFREIRVKLGVVSDASAAALDRWLEAVRRRCPVSDNLANTTPVRVEVERAV